MKKFIGAAVGLAAAGALVYRNKVMDSGSAAAPVTGQVQETAPSVTIPKDNRPRGIRNNNPLNIDFNHNNNWQGQIGTDGRFCIFDTPYNGIRAAGRLLRNYDRNYGLNTIRGIVSRWAPSNENDTAAYVQSVSKRSGLFADLILSPNDYPAVVAAMIYHENGQQPYDTALIAQAVYDGLA